VEPSTIETSHPDVPPVPLGYAAQLARFRPTPRLSSAGIALAVGLLLLCLSLYAMRGLMDSVMSPVAMASRNSDEFVVVLVLTSVFAGVCTLAALLFLFVGLRWLRAASQSVL
jgi:hypothetical protein